MCNIIFLKIKLNKQGENKLDITLERILSLLGKNQNGEIARGEKSKFASNLGLPHNVVAEWISCAWHTDTQNKGGYAHLTERGADIPGTEKNDSAAVKLAQDGKLKP